MKEFELIKRFFENKGPKRKDVLLGVGDDCAIVHSPAERDLVVSCDTLVEGVHFLADMPPEALAHKAVAANLSDLAAMGAEPAWMTLALTMPRVDEDWLEGFSQGIASICEYYRVQLIGGDTCRGEQLSMSITVHGHLPRGKGLRRSGAKAGDNVYVTGYLGDSALGLMHILGESSLNEKAAELALQRHYYPTPRVFAGQVLRDIANACMDLSDGLSSDLGHMLERSGVGAVIEVDQLPLSENLVESVGREHAIEMALAGGEDYELLFTVPQSQTGVLDLALKEAGVKFSRIGQIKSSPELNYRLDGKAWRSQAKGYQHFE
ncbi:thiamine-phosphate kinase [Paraferrimonas sedimenticola]|uniref:Thiamine-monophosphate kinase n=1 Tax=Paraferrimonas sedimenticola TaxID=375674 RepID=A0AA37RXJ2_9GAMM|nr:thiamine-phosphate kinase [Paraferrimonas sedimenticola]GLP96878.1 thiamine-monophosphate kinase [Paraferrimonas sedimenticola]